MIKLLVLLAITVMFKISGISMDFITHMSFQQTIFRFLVVPHNTKVNTWNVCFDHDFIIPCYFQNDISSMSELFNGTTLHKADRSRHDGGVVLENMVSVEN